MVGRSLRNEKCALKDLDFDEGTAAADALLTIAEVERQVRKRFPMIKRLFIESGPAPLQQRWSRPNTSRALAEHTNPVAPKRRSALTLPGS